MRPSRSCISGYSDDAAARAINTVSLTPDQVAHPAHPRERLARNIASFEGA
jgi:hypothetical protein